MNRTLLTFAGLLLAGPLMAQSPSENAMSAAELLRLSAEKAAAGQELEAAQLAELAMSMLTESRPAENKDDRLSIEGADSPQKGTMIVDGSDGRRIVEFITDMDSDVDGAHIQRLLKDVSGAWAVEGPKTGLWMVDEDDHHFAPMGNDDLHVQLQEIQYELESLRRELQELRSSMHGSTRRSSNRFPGSPLKLRGGARKVYSFGFDAGEGTPHMLELRGLDGMLEAVGSVRLPELRQMHLECETDCDTDGEIECETDCDEDLSMRFEQKDGTGMQENVVVIINGEKFTGDAAREKLEELNIEQPGHGKIRMEMRSRGGAFPTPPTPPAPPSGVRWRSKGHQHEDL